MDIEVYALEYFLDLRIPLQQFDHVLDHGTICILWQSLFTLPQINGIS